MLAKAKWGTQAADISYTDTTRPGSSGDAATEIHDGDSGEMQKNLNDSAANQSAGCIPGASLDNTWQPAGCNPGAVLESSHIGRSLGLQTVRGQLGQV